VRSTSRNSRRKGTDQARASGGGPEPATAGSLTAMAPRPSWRDKGLLAVAVALELTWMALLIILAVKG
jgi:hypothetical protein